MILYSNIILTSLLLLQFSLHKPCYILASVLAQTDLTQATVADTLTALLLAARTGTAAKETQMLASTAKPQRLTDQPRVPWFPRATWVRTVSRWGFAVEVANAR